ncbi:MAG: TIM barrel protein [Magnetococcales bacterium]|nr:N-acetylneuraminate synthase family protein [Magnetococcales bacterium]NGZ07537.1 TIM barrel protein [Magnetococcales bacterium]
MIIEKNISKYIIFAEDPLTHALHRIGENKHGVVFVLTFKGVLIGILSDGDFRRWLLASHQTDFTLPVSVAMNQHFTVLPETATNDQIAALFSERIKFIPLVDGQGRMVALASAQATLMTIGNRPIADDAPAFLIAEIGNNHNGSLELAMRLIDAAAAAGADCIKFQMRDLQSMYRTSDQGEKSEDLGAQYTLDLLTRFQLRNDELFQAFDYCKQLGIPPLCTPWDVASLHALERYGMEAYKVASADLTNHALLNAICKTRKPILCSTGMSTESEINDAIQLLRRNSTQFVLLHCNSTYPAPFKDIHLNYLKRLKGLSGGGVVGYSGHERGIHVAVAAVAIGARVIEKHFTLDRNMEGNDHRISLLPDEFREMVQGIRAVEQSFGTTEARKVTQGEMMNREVLAKSILAAKPIRTGDIIAATHLEIRSPGKGLPPYRWHELVGRVAKRDFAPGDFFYPSDLASQEVVPRPYRFDRPFGIPVRYHDIEAMIPKSNFDLLEFHLSYNDLNLDPARHLNPAGYDLDFVVHSPELFANDHIMNLCSDDPAYRDRSIQELQRVIDVTRQLKRYFKRATTPLIIINAGGFSLDSFLPKEVRQEKYRLIASALATVDRQGVEIIPQTMPPFPWHFGGQRYHNLFMEAEDIVTFCRQHQQRICLDISHSKLVATHFQVPFSLFMEQVAPFTAHLHLVDAAGVDGEGLQIGEGEIDFAMVAEKLKHLAPQASFIPEIWQGHKNDGEGFWIALERLESYFRP